MKQKTQILFLSRLYHPHVGGVEKHVEELSKELIKKGYSVTVLTEKFDDSLPSTEKIEEVNIRRIKIPTDAFLKKFYIWKWVVSNRQLFENAEIIHIHDVFFWILPLVPFLIHKRKYITFHGYEGYPIKKRWIWERKLAEWFTRGNICVGDFMKKWYKTNPTSVIYGAVRLRYQNKLPNPESAVFFGRLDRQTGFLEYMEAFEIVKKKFPKFRLTVVGEGEFEDKIPKEAYAHRFKKDIAPFLAENRFIFVSRYLSMLEALASNREVIAVYDNPVKKDYLMKSPFKKYISIAKDEKEIANYVLKSLGRRKTDRNEGFLWAKEKTWDKIVDDYLRLWEKY